MRWCGDIAVAAAVIGGDEAARNDEGGGGGGGRVGDDALARGDVRVFTLGDAAAAAVDNDAIDCDIYTARQTAKLSIIPRDLKRLILF
jgi:hypothetical protein